MNRSGIRAAAAALAVAALLLLTGCIRFQVELRLDPANTVDGSIVVAIIADDSEDGRAEALDTTAQIEQQLLGAVVDHPTVRSEEYSADGYYGTRYLLAGTPIDAFDGGSDDALRIVRDGDVFVVSGALDFTGQATPQGDGDELPDTDLAVTVTFPGEVLAHDGELDGRTVRWTTPITERREFEARGAAGTAGPPIGLVVGVAIAVLLVLAAIAVVLVVVLRRKRKPATPEAGMPDAAPAEPSAPTPPVEPPAAS